MTPAVGVRGPRIGPSRAAWVATGGLALALFAQSRHDARPDIWLDPLLIFLAAISLWVAAITTDRRQFAAGAPAAVPGPALNRRRALYLAASGAILLLSGVVWPALAGTGGLGFLDYPGGPQDGSSHLTALGLILWLGAIALLVAALGDRPVRTRLPVRGHHGGLLILVSGVALALLAILAVGAYYRFAHLGAVPLEMTSDHTEKLQDVARVLNGERPVFFHANAGREAIQFYWTALLVRLGLPNDFLTLKIGAGLVSLVTLPLVYVLGKRVAGTEAGLFAALLLALAPWHIQITRIGLRISWSPFFVALVLALLFRALSSGRRNDWLAAGLAAGVGVYGYTGFRPMALVIPAVILLRAWYAWRSRSVTRGEVRIHAQHALAAAAGALAVLVPLARYAADRPEFFWIRTFSRVAEAEVPIQGSVLGVLVSNWRNALLMVNHTADGAWFQSPPGRPALETIGGALFVLGVATAVVRAARGDWLSASLLVAAPLLLSSSALSLAFPHENPSLSRAAGAVIPVVVIAALALEAYGRRLRDAAPTAGGALFMGVCLLLFLGMSRNTGKRYFEEYAASYNRSTHNTTELAAVVRTFVQFGGDMGHAYLVGWRHGPDSRAIGQLAGDLDWQGLLWRGADGAESVLAADAHAADPLRKLYLVGGPEARPNIDHLIGLYPNALVTHHISHVAEKDFWSVLVPGEAAP